MSTKPDISQAMIAAYDEYTHLTLDRRRFMEKLTKLAGSGAAAAAIAPLLAANPARAAIIPPDDERIASEMVTFEGQSGPVTGYLARPAGEAGKLPAIIVVHENRGLNEHIKDVARRIALEGYMALAVDFLSPAGGTPEDEEKARELFRDVNFGQAVADAAAAVNYLAGREDSSSSVGAVGFCWGGGLVNHLAVASPDLKAAVAYYGTAPDAADVPKINADLLLHYAGLDDRVNAGMETFRQALESAGTEFTMHVYDGVNHAFNNDTAEARYNKEAADLAWQRTMEFFSEKLS